MTCPCGADLGEPIVISGVTGCGTCHRTVVVEGPRYAVDDDVAALDAKSRAQIQALRKKPRRRA